MSRPSQKVPAYCRHKASGNAVVRLEGKDHYLGEYGSDESHEAYEKLIAEWRAGKKPSHHSPNPAHHSNLSINQVLLRYLQFAETYYSKDGEPTKEFVEMKHALRTVKRLYGRTQVGEFGPLALKSVQQSMIEEESLSRGVINNRISRIKRFFKWAVSEQLAPPGTFEAIRTVSGLRYGKTKAHETEPVKPVPDTFVEAVLPVVAPPVRALIELQRTTGMRPCEVVLIRAVDIDMSGDVWLYEPAEHKNQWRGHRRVIPLGPKAQEIIKPFLALAIEAYLFSPKKAEEWRNLQRRQKRKTPLTPSQAGRKSKVKPQRAKRDRYDVDSYRRAISYGIKKANTKRDENEQIPQWCPLQLRHSRATELRKQFGIEAAQVVLGHARADITEVYAERDLEAAIRIAKETG